MHHPGSVERQEAVCLQIWAALEDNQGYQRKCFSRYTNHLDKIYPVSTTSASKQTTPSISRRKSSDKIICNPHCIFCYVAEPIRVSVGGKRVFLKTWLFEHNGDQGVIDIAHQHQDEKLLLYLRSGGTGKISQSGTDSCVQFKCQMLQLRLSHPDKNWLIQLQSTGAPREQSCIWIMYTDVSDILQMSLHMQPWHPAGACRCRLWFSHRTSATETDHHRLLSNDQWANNRQQICEGAPRKVPWKK